MRSFFCLLTCISLSVGLASHAVAYDDKWPSEDEAGILPEYCRPLPFIGGRPGTYDTSNPVWLKWYPLLGEGYKHTHHYCSGLNFIQRSYKVRGDTKLIRNYLTRAVNEFEYVLSHSPRDFILAPEILTQRARTHVRLKDRRKALKDFQTAIKLNPEYMQAYAGLIDLLLEIRKKNEAREVYEAGVKIKPESPALKQFEKQFGSS